MAGFTADTPSIPMATERKTKKPKQKIVSSLDKAIVHRVGITNCPHCDYNERGHDDDVWAKNALVLVTATVQGKHGSVVVVSECPQCFEKSWVHQPFSFFHDYQDSYPEDWKKAATAEHDRRHLAAVVEFADSLCAKCIHMRKLECDTLPIVRCTYGDDRDYLHSCFTETECAKFLPRKIP